MELYRDIDDVTLISVWRNHLWSDSVFQFRKCSFDPRKPIRVVFHGEESADGGGPRKEYFRLLCNASTEKSGLFFSKDRVVNFTANVSLFHQRLFHLVGMMIATALLHGGPAFPFFHKCLYDYIARNYMVTDATSADVANPETLEVIKKVQCIN